MTKITNENIWSVLGKHVKVFKKSLGISFEGKCIDIIPFGFGIGHQLIIQLQNGEKRFCYETEIVE